MSWRRAIPLSYWFDGGRRLFKQSRQAGEAPPAGELRPGELAANAADGALFVGKADGTAGRIVAAEGVRQVRVLSQAAYDSLVSAGEVDAATLYVVTG